MFDFDTACKKHSENLLFDIVELWERDNRVKHPVVLSLEERWDFFIRATDHRTMCQAA